MFFKCFCAGGQPGVALSTVCFVTYRFSQPSHNLNLSQPHTTCVMHCHMPYPLALTMIEDGRLLMGDQNACRFYGRVAYDDHYGGSVLDWGEAERIADGFGVPQDGREITYSVTAREAMLTGDDGMGYVSREPAWTVAVEVIW